MAPLSPEQFFGFLSASLLITLSPGPDNLLVLSIGASKGRKLGMAFGLGCGVGCLSHTFLAALGISALIAASPVAFFGLKIVGGAYLMYLGWQALRSKGGMNSRSSVDAPSGAMQLFGKGLFANAINPKVVMFFLAFLPPVCVSRPWGYALANRAAGCHLYRAGMHPFWTIGVFRRSYRAMAQSKWPSGPMA